MRIGFNLLLWTTQLGPEHEGAIDLVQAAGYDGVEIPVFAGQPSAYEALGRRLRSRGLEVTAIAVIPSADKNPLSADSAERGAALDHLRWTIDCAGALGAAVLCGPLHSPLGHFTGRSRTSEEWERGVAFQQTVGAYAEGRNVTVALEALNRFECYFLTTMAELGQFLDAVAHPRIRAMYDTFHANIEEKDPVAALRSIAPHLAHVHISENDRGTPGHGHVPWAATYAALREIGYEGFLTVEAFGRALPDLAAATRVWRDFFPSPEELVRDGLANIRSGLAAAGAR